jgi:hypothetical protein
MNTEDDIKSKWQAEVTGCPVILTERWADGVGSRRLFAVYLGLENDSVRVSEWSSLEDLKTPKPLPWVLTLTRTLAPRVLSADILQIDF